MTNYNESNNMRIEEMGEKKLVGYRVVCEGDQYVQEIPKAVQKLNERLDEIKHLIYPLKQIGAFVAQENTAAEDGYWVCFEVSHYEQVPQGMVTLTVPSQTYAIQKYKGKPSAIFHAYESLHNWIYNNGYKRLPNLWSLEIYSQWKEEDVVVDMCDPIQE